MATLRAGDSGRSWVGYSWLALLSLISLTPWLGTVTLLQFACVFTLGIVFRQRAWAVLPAALLFSFLFFGPMLLPGDLWRLPMAHFLLPLALTGFICLPFSALSREFRWIRRGEADTASWLLALTTCLVAVIAMLLWTSWTDNLGAGAGMVNELRGIPRWFLLLFGVPVFAFLNALVEEAIYRGVLQESLERVFPHQLSLSLGLQASAFAAAHYAAGFPNGVTGYLMTFVYALALGHLRRRTGGMLLPFLTHFSADLLIGYTLVMLAA